MNEEKVDLSALDPARDPERWESVLQSVVDRALARRRPSVSGQLRAWAKPTLALAAVIPLLVWLGTVVLPPRAAATATESDPGVLVASWAVRGELPSTSEMFQVLGGSHERN